MLSVISKSIMESVIMLNVLAPIFFSLFQMTKKKVVKFHLLISFAVRNISWVDCAFFTYTQFYKTIYGHNLQRLIKSLSVCPW
jgi:hypothetical protein